MLCTKCKKREAIYSPDYMEGNLCPSCYMSFFERQVTKALRNQKIFLETERKNLILIETLGKPSFVLKKLLKKNLDERKITYKTKKISEINKQQIKNFFKKEHNIINRYILPLSLEEISMIIINSFLENKRISFENIIFPFEKTKSEEIEIYFKIKKYVSETNTTFHLTSYLGIDKYKKEKISDLFRKYPDIAFSTIAFQRMLEKNT